MKQTVKIFSLFFMAALFFAAAFVIFFSSNSFSIDGSLDAINRIYTGNNNQNSDNGSGRSQTEDKNEIVLVAVGDIMLSRGVEQGMIARRDWEYPFLETADITSGADIAFGNLETTILKEDVIPGGSFTFRTDPQAVEGLEFAGFDVLSLANNHMMNFGKLGIESTIKNLNDKNISYVGAGLSEEEIYRPVVKDVGGVKFGFLAYSYSSEQARGRDGGVYGVAKLDADLMQKQVADLRKKADVVVVSMHAGTEYETVPNGSQKAFARAAVDAGAALVIGHHPHVVQTFEKYGDGYIIYSLGNFVFDQMWSEETRLGVIAKVTFDKNKIEKIDFVPVKIYNYAQPKSAEGKDREKILKRLEAEN